VSSSKTFNQKEIKMNVVTVTGNLGKDATLRTIPSGESVLQFSVADSQGKDKPSIWWSCSLWGKRAQTLEAYLLKGQQVTVIGQVTEREYAKDGETKKAMEIRVTDIALQGGKREESRPAAAPAPKKDLRPVAAPASSGFDDFEDMPF
jgi:single-strand DNA-binding protein